MFKFQSILVVVKKHLLPFRSIFNPRKPINVYPQLFVVVIKVVESTCLSDFDIFSLLRFYHLRISDVDDTLKEYLNGE